MRSDRLIAIYPVLEPKLKAVAFNLLRYSPANCDINDLLQEGVIAIKRTTTTKERPHTVSYLVQRAKWQMIRYLRHEESRTHHSIYEVLADFRLP
jgi:DNA-directed RNA polymerase specialized sigma subunit